MFIYTLCPTCIDSGRRSDGLGSGSAGGKHLLELGQYFVFEVDVELPDITELSEGPAAVSLEIVHARNPVVLHRRLLVFGVFAAMDRKSVVLGKSVSARVDLGVGRIITKK